MIAQEIKKQFLLITGNENVREHESILLGQQQFEAELYKEVETIDDLAKTIKEARNAELAYYILGLGFQPGNEYDIPGLVIKNNCRKFDILSMRGKIRDGQTDREQVFVSAESGVQLNQLVRFTLDESLGGLECFLGIGGTIGDALLQDELYASEDLLTSHIFTVRMLTKENDTIEVSGEPFLHPFSENVMKKKNSIPLSVVFALSSGDKTELWKKATHAAFKRNRSELLDPLKGNFQI